jgi:6-phosphogluconolactonase/glucosamine-6-phosphate isomerase/deaminase
LLQNCSDISSNIFFSIDTGCDEIAMSSRLYNDIFPDQLDILILTIGDDGHIASIFSDYKIKNSNDKIAFVDSDLKNKNFHSRITITPHVILKAKQIFVLAPTEKKRAVMKKILESQGNINYTYPGSLAIRGTWLLSN